MHTENNKPTSFSAAIQSEANAKAEAAQREAAIVGAAAAAYDAHVSTLAPDLSALLPTPAGLHKPTMRDGNPWLSYVDTTPECLAALLDAFPPLPLVRYRDARRNESGFRAPECVPERDGIETWPVDGLRIDAWRVNDYPSTFTAQWRANVGGAVIDFRAKVKPVHGITPDYTARVKRYNDGRILAVSQCALAFPKGAPGCKTLRYGAGSVDGFSTIVIYGEVDDATTDAHPVQDLVRMWAQECDERAVESRSAYLRVKAESDASAPPFVLELERFAERYAAQRMKAGTLEQFAALESDAAVHDAALARAQWPEYAREHGITNPASYGFDHYAWACAFLRRVGLYEVERDGKPYRYGAAWL